MENIAEGQQSSGLVPILPLTIWTLFSWSLNPLSLLACSVIRLGNDPPPCLYTSSPSVSLLLIASLPPPASLLLLSIFHPSPTGVQTCSVKRLGRPVTDGGHAPTEVLAPPPPTHLDRERLATGSLTPEVWAKLSASGRSLPFFSHRLSSYTLHQKFRGSALNPAWHWPLQRQGRACFLILASPLVSF